MRAMIPLPDRSHTAGPPTKIIASDDDKLAFITDYGSSVSVPNTIAVTAPGREFQNVPDA